MSIDLEQNDRLARLRLAARSRSGLPGATINPDCRQCAPADGASATPHDQG
jgi:hypothetical protein